MSILFHSRFHSDEEQKCVEQCLAGDLSSENILPNLVASTQALLRCEHFLFTPSGSMALELALLTCNITHGDQVILPSFNFPSAANAVLRMGATPIFCDIDPLTQNISASEIKAHITPLTKAVIIVHYAGVSADLDEISAICKRHSIVLIEDAAQGIGAKWGNKHLGTIGDFGVISFHATKNITCGEGGLLIMSAKWWETAQICAMHGTDRRRMLNKEQSRYSWQQMGTCALLSALNQSVLLAQMPYVAQVTAKRLAIASAYNKALANANIQLMSIPEKAQYNGHIYYIIFQNKAQRDAIQHALAQQNIEARTHYEPLHSSPAGKALGCNDAALPNTTLCKDTILRLPIHTHMTEADAEYVAHCVVNALKEHSV